MKKVSFFLLCFVLFSLSCENELIINTSRDTYHDPIGDITYLDGYFFTTNNDASGHAGPQIFLYKFSKNGHFVESAYDLGMNGHGYISIANDGHDLYLQSRLFNQIYKISTVGEHVYKPISLLGSDWQGSGIAFLHGKDSLFVLYRSTKSPTWYSAYICPTENPKIFGRRVDFNWPAFGKSESGILAVDYRSDRFVFLAVDTSLHKVLIFTDWDFQPLEVRKLDDSTAVGLCFVEDEIYLAYENRRIEKWASTFFYSIDSKTAKNF